MKSNSKIAFFGLLSAFLTGFLSSCSIQAEDVIPEGMLLIGSDCATQPYTWVADESEYTLPIDNHYGSFVDGYDIQIIKEIGKIIGLEVVIIQTQWQSLISDLQYGAVDLIIGGITDTLQRREVVDFSDEYYVPDIVLITQKSVAEQHPGRLGREEFEALIKDQSLVSQASTTCDNFIASFEENYGCYRDTPLPTFADAALHVATGGCFGAVSEDSTAYTIIQAYDNLGIITFDQAIIRDSLEEGDKYGAAIGIRKGMNKLKDAVNGALAQISQETRDKWMEEAMERSGN